MIVTIPLDPKPALRRPPHMCTFKHRDAYARYKNELALLFFHQCPHLKPAGAAGALTAALNLARITFTIRTPKNAPHLDGLPHERRPDLDNLIKPVWDSLLPQDSAVHRVRARKIWGPTGQIEIEV